jgi:hypothetical protein
MHVVWSEVYTFSKEPAASILRIEEYLEDRSSSFF